MPNRLTDPSYLSSQYRDSSNLDARFQLHARFSMNPYGWMPWVFDHLVLSSGSLVLELGCGPGDLWLENLSRLPDGLEFVLSDFSFGMVAQARSNLLENTSSFKFIRADAQAIPFPDEWFDSVIANHMLYHVPDRRRALEEISRVLKPGGYLYASTIGEHHMKELHSLEERFNPEISSRVVNPFTLENGGEQLSPIFSDISLHRYEDALEVTEVDALVAYALSGTAKMREAQSLGLTEFVEQEMASQGGAIRITKDSGMFKAYRR